MMEMSPRKKRRAPRQESLLGRLRGFAGSFLRGEGADERTANHIQEIKGLLLVGWTLWLLVSLLSYPSDPGAAGHTNWGGQAGWYLADWAYVAIGWSAYFLVFLGFTWGAVLVAQREIGRPLLRAFGGVSFLFASAFLFQLGFGEDHGFDLPYGPGGYLALELVGPGVHYDQVPPVLVEKLGRPGLWILLGLSTIIAFMLATEMAFYPAMRALQEWLLERREESGESLPAAVGGWLGRLFSGLWSFLRGDDLEVSTVAASAVLTPAPPRRRSRSGGSEQPELFGVEDEEQWEGEEDEEDEEDEEEEDEEEEAWEEEDEEEDEDEEEEGEEEEQEEQEEKEEYDTELDAWDEAEELTPEPPGKSPAAIQQEIPEPPTPPPGEWKLPSLDILEPPDAQSLDDSKRLEKNASRLENVLKSFRVEANVVGAKVGPAVTLFELEVAQGTRMNKVTQLSQEIAAALRAKSVRIIAPIPGRATIGIEVPNEKRRVVMLSELITQKAYDKHHMALPLFLGMDAEGAAIVEDLARMPHLLIAGTTGSGKSVCINCILASFLLTRSPHDVQLILVDPKMVELQMFSTVPHLMLPVVTDMRQATNVLLWAVEKMEGRYDLFKRAGVRNLKSYNALGEEGLRERMGEEFHEERTPRHVPFIVIVIDEMADLMMTSKKEAEQTITRLAQKSRAVGIHVIVATQRPSTDVITGVLKGNLPTRIAFQVASKIDSRVILDHMGAEKLLGQGDMLYTPPQSSQIRRVQGALVEDHEIQGIVDFVSQESVPTFNQELVQSASGATRTDQLSGSDQDELFDEAVRIVLKSRRGSASLLQRALGVGYTRASRLIDIMTAEGIVGEHKGSKAREVLMSLEDWNENQEAIAEAEKHP